MAQTYTVEVCKRLPAHDTFGDNYWNTVSIKSFKTEGAWHREFFRARKRYEAKQDGQYKITQAVHWDSGNGWRYRETWWETVGRRKRGDARPTPNAMFRIG